MPRTLAAEVEPELADSVDGSVEPDAAPARPTPGASTQGRPAGRGRGRGRGRPPSNGKVNAKAGAVAPQSGRCPKCNKRFKSAKGLEYHIEVRVEAVRCDVRRWLPVRCRAYAWTCVDAPLRSAMFDVAAWGSSKTSAHGLNGKT